MEGTFSSREKRVGDLERWWMQNKNEIRRTRWGGGWNALEEERQWRHMRIR